MTKVKMYGYVYGENMDVPEVREVADEIIRRYKKKEIPYGKAMKQINYMYVLTFSKAWRTAYRGNLTELRDMLKDKKNELRSLVQ